MRSTAALLTLLLLTTACGSDDEPAASSPGGGASSAGAAGMATAAGGSGGMATGAGGAGGAGDGGMSAAAGEGGGSGEGGSTGAGICAVKPQCVELPAGATEEQIADTFATAKSGDTIVLPAGTFKLTNGLALTGDDVTVMGQGPDKTTLDFSGQVAGSEGIFAQSVQNLTLKDFSVKDTKGNGIKVLGAQGVTFLRVNVSWTGDNPTKHGAYGLYPVESKDVLIDSCAISGASDAGIYVGQSDRIIVTRCEAFENVAGIEIENSYNADVIDNHAHDNTGGVLVFDMPNLPQKAGHFTRVIKNKIENNNTDNFAPKGNIVGLVPAGTGVLVMANHDIEVLDNDVVGNKTAAVGVVSYFIAQDDGFEQKDPTYYPYPARVYIHDNRFMGNGTQPDIKNQVGLGLLTGKSKFPDGIVPPVLYDGIVDPMRMGPEGNPMELCVGANEGLGFANLHLDKVDFADPNLANTVTLDMAPYSCTLDPLPAIVLEGKAP